MLLCRYQTAVPCLLSLILFFGMLAFSPALQASVEEPRMWTNTDGVEMRASLTSFDLEAGRVSVIREDGRLFVFSINELSEKDKRYLRERARAKRSRQARNRDETENESMEPWKKTALERINRNRMADVEVIVTDVEGKPIPEATVALHMRKRAFLFGSAINVPTFMDGFLNKTKKPEDDKEKDETESDAEENTGPDTGPKERNIPPDVAIIKPNKDPDIQRYREVIEEWFNVAVFENAMKPAPFGWLNKNRRAQVYGLLNWLEERDIKVRGHYLVGHAKFFVDGSVQTEATRLKAREHGKELAWTLRNRFFQWDAYNHPLATDSPYEHIALSLRQARLKDPQAELYLNEQWVIAGGDDSHRAKPIYRLAKRLQEDGVPIDGIGAMAHYIGGMKALTPPEKIYEIVDSFEELGLPVIITEHDIPVEDPGDSKHDDPVTSEEIVATYSEKFLLALYSHPNVKGILLWGFWDGAQWRDSGILYDKDWNLKPSGEVYKKYLFDEWWTEETGQTNEWGHFATRGHFGEYDLVVTIGEREYTRTFTLDKHGKRLHIVDGAQSGQPRQTPFAKETKAESD